MGLTIKRHGYCDKHAHLERNWSNVHKKSASARGYGYRWQCNRKPIIERDKGLCQPCLSNGRVVPFFAVDHIIPKSKGGTDKENNLQCICRQCHKDKTLDESISARVGG